MPYSLVALAYMSQCVEMLTAFDELLKRYFQTTIYPKLSAILYPLPLSSLSEVEKLDLPTIYSFSVSNKPIVFSIGHRHLITTPDLFIHWLDPFPPKDFPVFSQQSDSRPTSTSILSVSPQESSETAKIQPSINKKSKLDLSSFLDLDSGKTSNSDLISSLLQDADSHLSNRRKRG